MIMGLIQILENSYSNSNENLNCYYGDMTWLSDFDDKQKILPC